MPGVSVASMDELYRVLRSLEISGGTGHLAALESGTEGIMFYIRYSSNLTPLVGDVGGALSPGEVRQKFAPLMGMTINYMGENGYEAKPINSFEPILKTKPRTGFVSKLFGERPKGNTFYIDMYKPAGIRVFFSDIDVDCVVNGALSEGELYRKMLEGVHAGTATLLASYGIFLKELSEKKPEAMAI